MRILTRPVLLSPLVICGFFLNVPGFVEGGTIDPVLEAGQKIHATSKVFGSTRWDDPGLVIDSPIPVSVLRYHDSRYLDGEAPLIPGEVHVIVKSHGCPDNVVESIVASITTTSCGDYTDSVTIGVVIGDDNVDVVDSRNALVEYDFPDPATTFHAVWDYVSFWCSAFNNDPDSDPALAFTCPPAPAQDISSGPSTSPTTPEMDPNIEDITMSPTSSPSDESGSNSMLRPKLLSCWTVGALLLSSALFFFHSNTTTDRSLMTLCFVLVLAVVVVGSDDIKDNVNAKAAASRELQEGTCRIGAEVLLDACFQSLSITAPSIRVLDVVTSSLPETCDPSNPCRTLYEADLAFPGSVVFPTNMTTTPADEGRETFDIPTLNSYDGGDFYSNCARAIEGRPFVDASGSHLQAKAVEVDTPLKDDDKTKWSACFEDKIAVDLSSDTKQSYLKSLAVEWTRRALGEHASIASFAAFTMALLTNQAPPDLVEDSLSAAMDEVRHAKVSFEVASLLRSATGEGPVEPGPLPPSTHQFESDMTALVSGAAKEGCIDETLSALAAAAEADFYGAAADSEDITMGVISSILQEKMNIIAMEEGRHSILAWRTVHWACLEDHVACEAVKEVFDVDRLARAARVRFSDAAVNREELEREWKHIHEVLVPLVTTRSFGVPIDVNCSRQYESQWNTVEVKSTIKRLADSIINGVYCSISSKPRSGEKAQ